MSVESISSEETVELNWEESRTSRYAEKASWCAQKLLGLHSSLFDGMLYFIKTPVHLGQYGQCSHWATEGVRRGVMAVSCFVLWGSFLIPSIPIAAFDYGARWLCSKSYRVIQGSYDKEPGGRLLYLNSKSLSEQSGLADTPERYERLIATIRDNDPDIAFVPEVNRKVCDQLLSALKDRYHFLFYGMGQRTCVGDDTAFFIAFRGDLASVPEYEGGHSSDVWKERGCFFIEKEEAFYCFLENPSMKDLERLSQKDFKEKKVVLMGDFGFDRKDPRYQFLVDQGFASPIPEGEKTTTNAPYAYYHKTGEVVIAENLFLMVRGEFKGKVETRMNHSPELPQEALSNQKLIIANL